MDFKSLIARAAVQQPAITRLVLNTIRKSGFDIVSGTQAPVMLRRHHKINLILDVGANVGQFALQNRALGYLGRIVSFEPLATEYAILSREAERDVEWTTRNFGLSNYDGDATIHVSRNTVFSSMLGALPVVQRFDADSDYVSEQQIAVHKLDSIFQEYYKASDNVLLKVDVQGSEWDVLAGAEVLRKS